MGFGPLDEFLQIGGTIVSVFNPAIGGLMLASGKALDAKEKSEQQALREYVASWTQKAVALAGTNSAGATKFETLKGAIRLDLLTWKGKEPKERDVENYATLVVKGIKGDFLEKKV